MKRLGRFALRLLTFLTLLAVVAVAGVCGRIGYELPRSGSLKLSGLSSKVTADFDARGIPTVRAENRLDALRAEGYLVARDRMFQLEVQRRAGAGTLSEVFGDKALPTDKVHRLYGFRQVADEAARLLPANELEEAEAYAAGVNAFLESNGSHAAIEFDLLRITPARWTPSDSILVLLLMHESLSSSFRDELAAEALGSLPESERRFLMPQVTEDDVLLIPDADPKPRPEATMFFEAKHATSAPNPFVPSMPADTLLLPAWAGATERGIGSNSWVIAPSRSKSGRALLANDPHLVLNAPSIWYEVRFEFGARWVEGVSLAGIPGIVIGQTDRVAWGLTNLFTDVQDLYREEPISERVESIPVRGGGTVEYRVPVGKHGPQVRNGYSLKWAALDPHNIRLPLGAILDVVDWKTFNDAFDGFFGPAQSAVYADIDGHIGWRATGLLPLRRAGDDGGHVHDGNDPREDWTGYLPMSELPRVFDPPSGYLVAANQRLIGTSFPHPVSTRWVGPNRARRISERIEAAGKLDREAMESIQLDVLSNFHRELMKLLAVQVPSLARFRNWDGRASDDSDLFLDAHAWEIALHAALLERVLKDAEAARTFRWLNDDSTLLAMLKADSESWTAAGLGDKASLLLDAGKRAEAWRQENPARTWGEWNRLTIHHAIGRAGGLLAKIFDPPGFPQSGGGDTVRATGHEFGQSMRFIVDWAQPEASTLVLPLGESGHVGSSHRFDQEELWRRGDPGGENTRLRQAKAGEGIVFQP